MNATITYYGLTNDYESANVVKVNDFKDYLTDVVFDELINDEKFIKEAEKARSKIIRNPQNFPSISSKYKNLIEK